MNDVLAMQVLERRDELSKVSKSAVGSKLADGREKVFEGLGAKRSVDDEEGPAFS